MDLPILAVTPGEPAGIGPECVIKFAHEHPGFRLLVIGDPDLMQETAQHLGIPFEARPWQQGDTVEAGAPAIAPVELAVPARAGQLNPANAAYVLDCLKKAVQLVRQGHAGALVTGPVHKGVINDAGIAFSGHTEFLAGLSSVPRVVMMLAAKDLRVALVTTHLPLRDVPDAITREAVEETIRITEAELRQRFGIPSARIQVLGLNPHAGEGGHLGNEEQEVIEPVIRQLKASGLALTGPVPADAAFTHHALKDCDAVVAMYHDQGLPVLKHAGFGHSVNITLGLPFIRTSVDHGTALDIAGSGIARADSLFHAAGMAQRMCMDSIA